MFKIFSILSLFWALACATVPALDQTPKPEPTPVASVTMLVKLGTNLGPSVDKAVVQRSIDLLNQVFENGCLEKKLRAWEIPDLENAESYYYADKLDAYARLIKSAPYALDIRWYNQNSTVMGYTYNWLKLDNGATDYSKSETRIWTNRSKVWGPKTYAAHMAHELSHQIRSGGFTHSHQFQGSVPYEFGDIAYSCLTEGMGTKTLDSSEKWLEFRAMGLTQ